VSIARRHALSLPFVTLYSLFLPGEVRVELNIVWQIDDVLLYVLPLAKSASAFAFKEILPCTAPPTTLGADFT
jgi:hypothetical protein